MFEIHMIDAVGRAEADHARRSLTAAERRMALDHDLKLLRAETPRQPPAFRRWLGDRLVRIGERLRSGSATRVTRRA